MKRKAVLAIMLTLLFIGIFSLAFDIQQVEASGTITIKADGSIEGTTYISTVDNVTYTFTANINDSIVVERNNITIDGAGYTVQGTGSGTGIALSDRNNVTLKNVEVTNFNYGIYFLTSSNNTLAGNTVSSNNWDGIRLSSSSNNTVTGNTVSNNYYGIELDPHSSNNFIYHNNFINNTNQVYIPYSGYANFWDDGYPSGGNYWSDYEEKYPNATEIDGSGIWDTPYVIDENNQDNYPIIPEFPTWTSMLLLLIVLTVPIAIYKRRLLKTPIH